MAGTSQGRWRDPTLASGARLSLQQGFPPQPCPDTPFSVGSLSNHTAPNPSHKHPSLMAIRSPELPETPGNPAGALQAGVDAGTGLQRDEATLTHIFAGNPTLFMDNLKIQLKEILQFLGNNFLSSSKAFHILHIATL